MEKRTVLAVVLSILVILIFSLIQGMMYTTPEIEQQTESTAAARPVESTGQPVVSSGMPASQPVVTAETTAPQTAGATQTFSPHDIQDSVRQMPVITEVIETDKIRVVLSNAGGDIISYELLDHNDRDAPVNMVMAGKTEPHAFTINFGNRDDVITGRAKPIDSHFRVERPYSSPYTVIFSQDFEMGTGDSAGRFTLTKRYDFTPGEYMFELTISIDGGYSFRNFDFNGAAYTLVFGPQIGPYFEKLDQRAEFRQYLTSNNNKVRQERINVPAREVPDWTAIVGKYFVLIAVPNMTQYDVYFSDQKEEGIPSASRMLITRPAVNNSRIEDKYYFYMGPKKQEILETYYNGKNNFLPPLHGFRLTDAAKTQTLFSIPPLENLLKLIMTFFYAIIPNYGIAIILLTFLVKLLLFPLTRKSSESTLRMQTLAPKIKEIQEKHKDNKQKMNIEMAEFYKKEGYNPLSGCLPMLIQMPIFFAMYNLFNNHFDLRGAMFIPGWIPDLSLPESVFNFAPIELPILGWSDIRLLPFLYVGSQLLYGKVTQTPNQSGAAQMKFMLYIMPIVFFFILYDVPSGLLLYWIMSNLLTMAQQIIINKYIANKKAAIKEPEPIIAPKKKKRK